MTTVNIYDIHNLRVKQTPDITFNQHYRENFDAKKIKKIENVANRASNDNPEIGILLFSILLSLSNPKKKSFVKYLTSRSILLQKIGELHLSEKDNNILYMTRHKRVNYFVAQSHLLEKIGDRKALVVLQHGLSLHPENPILLQRIEKLSKKKICEEKREKILKAEEERIKFMRIPFFLRPEEVVFTPEDSLSTKLSDLSSDLFEYHILPHVDDRDLLRISQVSFSFRNFVAQYYERKYEESGKKFQTFIREEFPLMKKIKDIVEYGKYFDLLLSYCFRLYCYIDEKDVGSEERGLVNHDEYSIYRRQLSSNESLWDESIISDIMKDGSNEKRMYGVLCKEAKMFYQHSNGLVPGSLNYKNSITFFRLHNKSKKFERWRSNEYQMGPYAGLGGIQNLVDYRMCVNTKGVRSHMKNSKSCVFLEFREPDYSGDTYNFILDNRKSDVFLEGWEIPDMSVSPASRYLSRYGSFIAHLNQINHQICVVLSYLLEKIIEKANIIMKKR